MSCQIMQTFSFSCFKIGLLCELPTKKKEVPEIEELLSILKETFALSLYHSSFLLLHDHETLFELAP